MVDDKKSPNEFEQSEETLGESNGFTSTMALGLLRSIEENTARLLGQASASTAVLRQVVKSPDRSDPFERVAAVKSPEDDAVYASRVATVKDSLVSAPEVNFAREIRRAPEQSVTAAPAPDQMSKKGELPSSVVVPAPQVSVTVNTPSDNQKINSDDPAVVKARPNSKRDSSGRFVGKEKRSKDEGDRERNNLLRSLAKFAMADHTQGRVSNAAGLAVGGSYFRAFEEIKSGLANGYDRITTGWADLKDGYASTKESIASSRAYRWAQSTKAGEAVANKANAVSTYAGEKVAGTRTAARPTDYPLEKSYD